MRLPRTLDQLSGLRAARWIRESTRGQVDRFGPEAQRDQQDRVIERHGLVDAGISWTVAHSGRTVAGTTQFGEMLAAAGRDYDVLVVGYVSRFARDLRTAVNARHDLHAAGAAILFADERVLSSDEDAWETFAREAVEAEAYSRRLGKRIREGYAAKFRRLADQGGQPPLGFRRSGPSRTLEVDPASVGRAVALFERYAGGSISIEDLAAEAGMATSGVQEILRNPIYNGWVGRKGDRAPAPWRAGPPVSDDVWARVEDLRELRRRHGGSRHPDPDRVDLLRGILRCACGQRIRTDGTMGTPPRIRKLHPGHADCTAWGTQASYSSATWEGAVISQLTALEVTDQVVADVVAAVTAPEPPPVSIDPARLERRRRELAMAFADERLTQDEFAAAIARLRQEEPAAPARHEVTAERAVWWLRHLHDLWLKATLRERAELIAAVYAEIVVVGKRIVRARLTPDAVAHGLLLALPESGAFAPEWVLARPTGVERVGSLRLTIRGAAEWRRAVTSRRLA